MEIEKRYFFKDKTQVNCSINSESGTIVLDKILLQKIDTDLSHAFTQKKIGALEKGGYELSLSSIKYQEDKGLYILDAYLNHPQFYNFFIQIEGKYKEILSKNDIYTIFNQPVEVEKWQFSWCQNEEIAYLKKYFSKPIKPPFDVKNLDFKVEYWTSDYPNMTYLTIEFIEKTSKEILENTTKGYFESILSWGNFISEFGHIKGINRDLQAFQIDDEAMNISSKNYGEPSFQIKEISDNTLKISLAFNEFQCYWTAEWYLRWLSFSMPSKISKVTFEWVF